MSQTVGFSGHGKQKDIKVDINPKQGKYVGRYNIQECHFDSFVKCKDGKVEFHSFISKLSSKLSQLIGNDEAELDTTVDVMTACRSIIYSGKFTPKDDPMTLISIMETLSMMNLVIQISIQISIMFRHFMKSVTVDNYEKVLKHVYDSEHEIYDDMPDIQRFLINFYFDHKQEIINLDGKYKPLMKIGKTELSIRIYEQNLAYELHQGILLDLRKSLFKELFNVPFFTLEVTESSSMITVQSLEDKKIHEFRAHKAILVAGAESFQHFLNNTHMKKEEVLDLTNFSFKTVQSIMGFIYMGEYTLPDDPIDLPIANTGCGAGVKSQVKNPISDFCDVFGVYLASKVLLLFDPALKKKCHQYIFANIGKIPYVNHHSIIFTPLDLLKCINHPEISQDVEMTDMLTEKLIQMIPKQRLSMLEWIQMFVSHDVEDEKLWNCLSHSNPIDFKYFEEIQSVIKLKIKKSIESAKSLVPFNLVATNDQDVIIPFIDDVLQVVDGFSLIQDESKPKSLKEQFKSLVPDESPVDIAISKNDDVTKNDSIDEALDVFCQGSDQEEIVIQPEYVDLKKSLGIIKTPIFTPALTFSEIDGQTQDEDEANHELVERVAFKTPMIMNGRRRLSK